MRESRCAQAVHMLLWQCYLIDPAGCVFEDVVSLVRIVF